MINEAPVQLLGQNVFSVSGSGGAPSLAVILSGQNTRGIILRTACIVSNAGPYPGIPATLYADTGVTAASPPSPPPPGVLSSTRYIIIASPAIGYAQLSWPIFLEPGLGLVYNAPTTVQLYGTWDHVSAE